MHWKRHSTTIGILCATLHAAGTPQQTVSPPGGSHDVIDSPDSENRNNCETQPQDALPPTLPTKVEAQTDAEPGAHTDPAPPPPPLERYVSSWELLELGEPILPVFGAAVVMRHDMIALIGGFTQRLEATPVVQLHNPRRGWLPIGSQMMEPRAAGHTMTDLGDGRVLIVGGVQGRLGSDIRPVLECEIIDPLKAGSTSVDPIDEPMLGHTAHAWRDARAIVIGGSSIRVFDAARMQWTHRVPLAHPRRDHASVLVRPDRLIIIGGDGRGTIEMVDLVNPHAASSQVWPTDLGLPLHSAAACALPDGRIFIVGGIDAKTGRSIDRTWLLDPRDLSVAPGPALQIERGVAKARLHEQAGMIIIAGGEWVEPDDRGPSSEARMYETQPARMWIIDPPPLTTAMTNWFRTSRGELAFVGGMQFISPDQAAARGVAPGILTRSEAWRLRISRLPTLRD